MFDFPSSSLTVGQIVNGPNATQFRWDGVKWVVAGAASGGSANITISDTAPANPTVGNMWFDSAGLQTYLWYADPTSSQWTPLTNQGGVMEAPTDGQTYGRYNASWNAVLPLTGGSLTGALTIAPPAGVDALNIAPVAANNAKINLNKSSAAYNAQIVSQLNGLNRWNLILGNSAAESGTSTGSDFALSRFNNTGAFIDQPFSINRSSGAAYFSGGLNTSLNLSIQNSQSGGWPTLFLNKSASGLGSQIVGQTNGSNRWLLMVGDSNTETGSNAGSHLTAARMNDGGTFIDYPLSISRTTGVATFSQPIVNGSDAAFKRNVKPIKDALAKVTALKGVAFDRIGSDHREIGLIAQDVEKVVPEVVYETPGTTHEDMTKAQCDLYGVPRLGISYAQLTALLVEAIKTLTETNERLDARVKALEATHV